MSDRDTPRRMRTDVAAAIITFVVAFVLIPSTVDVDLWGHVRFGGDIVHERAIPTVDPYSFTSDRPWVNHEWLTELSMYAAFSLAGPAGLTMLRLALIALTLSLVGWSVVRDGVRPPRLHMLLAFVAILTYARTQHVRPQLFSLVLFAALLLLIRMRDQRPRAIYLAPFLMAFWVNLHGGWIVGLGVLGLWAAIEAVSTGSTWRRRIELSAVVTFSGGATLLNPYGPGMWAFLWETVGLGREDISEWLPIVSSEPGVIALWCTTAAMAIWAIRSTWIGKRVERELQPGKWQPRWSEAAIVAALGLLSFRVSRLDAFFCLAVFMLLGPALVRAMRSSLDGRVVGAPSVGVVTAAALVLALVVRWPAATSIDLASATWLPEADVVTYLRNHERDARVLTYFDWGEYAIWHLSPTMKVSMDGRRETVYSTAPIAAHLAVYDNRPGAIDYVRQLRPDYIWLPKASPVIAALHATGEWTTAFDGERSVVLATRAVGAQKVTSVVAASAVRVFPGP